MWKPFAIIFFALTLGPGVLVLISIFFFDHFDLESGEIFAVIWLFAVVGIVCTGIKPGVKDAQQAERRSHGKCLVCGYDIRMTPERCPECGTVPQ